MTTTEKDFNTSEDGLEISSSTSSSSSSSGAPESGQGGRRSSDYRYDDDEEMADNHHSLPTPDEIKVDYSGAGDGGRSSTGWKYLMVVFILLLAAAILSVSLILSNERQEDNKIEMPIDDGPTDDENSSNVFASSDDADDSEEEPTPDLPTPDLPTPDLPIYTGETRMDLITNFLLLNNINSASDFEDKLCDGNCGTDLNDNSNTTSSPQYRALHWIANEDEQALSPVPGGLDKAANYELLTRYVMTLLYYTTKGEGTPTTAGWIDDVNFLNGQRKTCEWNDVFPDRFKVSTASEGDENNDETGEHDTTMGVLCDDTTEQIYGISFYKNNLGGPFPKELVHLTTLTLIESISNANQFSNGGAGNNITEMLPSEFSNLSNLKTLIFAFNKLTGTIPSWLGELESLEVLYLSNNMLTGQIPEETMRQLTNLKALALDDNLLTGSINVVWEALNQIRYLYLEDNTFTGQLPTVLLNAAPHLVSLDVSGNSFHGPLSDDLFQLTDLEILDLHDNAFTGGIPKSIQEGEGSSNTLRIMALQRNQLALTIPTTLAHLTKLTHLDLSTNDLTGVIPNELGSLNDLAYIFLAENDFERGAIPPIFSSPSFPHLRELSLKSTKRYGHISDIILPLSSSAQNNLVVLDLDNNELSGSIPTEVGLLSKLSVLLLQRNDLMGFVPTQLGNLTELEIFSVYDNEVTGSLEPVCDIPRFTVVLADCGDVACPCCNQCCDEINTMNDAAMCNTLNQVADLSPTWEHDYQRLHLDFTGTGGGVRM